MFMQKILLLLSACTTIALGDHIFGFNYGSHWSNGTAKTTSDFQQQFNRAIANRNMEHELAALNKALALYGQDLINLVEGISIGNKDIFQLAESECEPDCADTAIVKQWVDTVRSNLTSGPFASDMANIKIGHVDTVNAWSIEGMQDLVESCDFIGVTIYPFWGGVAVQDSSRSVSSLLQQAQLVAGSKPVYVAETGWPWAGETLGNAITSLESAQQYWKTVACNLPGSGKGYGEGYDTWWFQLEDDSHDKMQWSVLDSSTRRPRYDLACAEDDQRHPNGVHGPTHGDITLCNSP
ncbi:glycoside hydrolase [Lizonia empirigonia]|nr:glycoside hydrolase [Lizonia empirigonia]